jgi:phosphoglycerate dehydrogenase-like enzyme
MAIEGSVAVLSRSFSKNPVLRAEMEAAHAHVVFNDAGLSLKDEALVAFASGHAGLIVALEKMDASVLEQLPDLKAIGKYGVGIDNVDLTACQRLGIKVGWTGGVNKRSVAELALSLMIACLRSVVRSDREIRDGRFSQIPGRQLSGRTVGLVGCGHVGQELVRLLAPFGCRVLVHDIRDLSDFYAETGAAPVSFETLIAESEIVSLHVPLTAKTRHLFDAQTLSRMRPGAVLVNTARGGLADEAAVRDALASGHLGAAAFDVFSPEPPVDLSLMAMPTFISTGHIGGSTEEAVVAMGRAAIRGLLNPVDALDHVPDYLRAGS